MKRQLLAFCLLATTGAAYSQTGNVGIGTTTPGTRLDVNGAITNRETTVTVTGGVNANLPAPFNWSQVQIIGAATDTVTVNAPAAPNSGQRLILYNNTTGGYGVRLNSFFVPNGQALEFIYSNSQWLSTATRPIEVDLRRIVPAVAVGGVAAASHITVDAGNGLNGSSVGTGTNNFAIGYGSLQSNTTGGSNIGIGTTSLQSNLSGSQNVGVGANVLRANTTGGQNVGVGALVLQSNNGFRNVGVGFYALGTNSTGNGNSAIGNYALNLNTTGENNSAVGIDALKSNASGSANTAMGSGALGLSLTGSFNTAYGSSALQVLSSGGRNVAVGSSAGLNITSGTGNIFIGTTAGNNIITASDSLIIANDEASLYINGNIKNKTLNLTGQFSADSIIDRKLLTTTSVNSGDRVVMADGTGKLKAVAQSAFFENIRVVAGTTTVNAGDYTIVLQAVTSGTTNVTVPTASSNNTGRIIVLVNYSNNAMDTGASYMTAVGSTTTVAAGSRAKIQSTGSNWILIGD